MKFALNLSLEHRALVKIVVTLWSQNDVRALMVNLFSSSYFSHRSEEWKTIEEKVIEKVSQLSLPQLLNEKLLSFVKPIGLQIYKWVEYHQRYRLVNLPAELCWTPQGTVDRKKTAQVLCKDESLDLSTRYKLACIYCLENDILELWKSSTEDLKASFLDTGFYYINDWSRNMRRGSDNAHIYYKNEFQQCARRGNKVAAEYFLKKLTPSEREASLVETAKGVERADVLYFLLTEMDEQQQLEVFKNNPYRVLYCFLQWPLQSFFMGIANCMWNFLSKEYYYILLRDLIAISNILDNDCNYQNLLRKFWQKSPHALKCFITDEIDKSWLLPFLFHLKDKEIIRLILKDATLTVKHKLIYSDKMNNFCQDCIRDNEWDFLKFCIRECFPSKDEMLKFKEEFEKRVHRNSVEGNLMRNKQKWDQLFCLPDDSICKTDKRSLDEGESSSCKRFKSLQ